MGRGKDSGKDEEDGAALWADFARDIKPIGGRREAAAHKPDAPPKREKPKTGSPAAAQTPRTKAPQSPPQLDGSTQAKLRKGKIPIEGRLDLHGMTQSEAQDALEAFVLRAAGAGKRCLLVITGKGLSRGEGVLRQRLPQWIALPPLSHIVLKAVPAAPKDGGSGAFYLYLKRQR